MQYYKNYFSNILYNRLQAHLQDTEGKNVHEVSKSSLISILIEWAVDLLETYWREKYQSPRLAHQSSEAAWHSWRGYPGAESILLS